MRIRMLNILELRYYRFDIPLTVKDNEGAKVTRNGIYGNAPWHTANEITSENILYSLIINILSRIVASSGHRDIVTQRVLYEPLNGAGLFSTRVPPVRKTLSN